MRKVYVTARGQGDTFINITSTIDLKIKALQQHVSQLGDWDDLGDRMREWTAGIAQGKEMAYAEGFRVVTLEDDETWKRLQEKE